MTTPSVLRLSSLPLLLAAATLLLPATAEARGHGSRVSGPRGGTLSRQVERQPGTMQKSSTFTNAAGQTTTHNASRTVDANGVVQAQSSTTYPDGRTSSRSLVSTPTENGRVTTETATHRNGKTSTTEATTTRTDDGYTRKVVTTGPNGGTKTKDVEVSRADGTTTRTATTARTPPTAPAPAP